MVIWLHWFAQKLGLFSGRPKIWVQNNQQGTAEWEGANKKLHTAGFHRTFNGCQPQPGSGWFGGWLANWKSYVEKRWAAKKWFLIQMPQHPVRQEVRTGECISASHPQLKLKMPTDKKRDVSNVSSQNDVHVQKWLRTTLPATVLPWTQVVAISFARDPNCWRRISRGSRWKLPKGLCFTKTQSWCHFEQKTDNVFEENFRNWPSKRKQESQQCCSIKGNEVGCMHQR